MNRAETLKIMAVLRVAYPAYYSRMERADLEATVALWADMFQDEPYDLVNVAIKSFIATDTEGYPPNIGKIKEAVRKILQPEQMTEQEAIALIMKASRNAIYNARKEYEKLPEICQKLVGDPQQLKDWSVMPAREVNTVISSNLQRSYKVLAQRERELQALPSSVKQFVLAATDTKLISN